jgi:exportin-T
MWYSFMERSTKVRLPIMSLPDVFDVLLAGTKGRTAFCHTPAEIAKEKRKETDYSEYPLTRHGEMLYALVQSKIAEHPHRTVAMQFFETVARYGDFFKVRKDCIVPALVAMVGPR